MRVELLFWEGCPSHPRALVELRAAMADAGLDPSTIAVREIHTHGEATRERFVGSPTIRVDGVDVQPLGEEPVGLTCRVYHRRDGRVSPTPDPADVREALHAAQTAAAETTVAQTTAAEAEPTETDPRPPPPRPDPTERS